MWVYEKMNVSTFFLTDFHFYRKPCVCVCVSVCVELPCSSGDLPAGSSLVISSGTQRLCSSRVNTDRHRQSTRQPLEGTIHRETSSNATAQQTAFSTSVIPNLFCLMNSSTALHYPSNGLSWSDFKLDVIFIFYAIELLMFRSVWSSLH